MEYIYYIYLHTHSITTKNWDINLTLMFFGFVAVDNRILEFPIENAVNKKTYQLIAIVLPLTLLRFRIDAK